MSMRCEDVRPLLAELVYEEVDPGIAEALREHLGNCIPCRRHQRAFLEVRQDLNRWQPDADATGGSMTFIAPGVGATAPVWRSRVLQGLAVAATLVLGVFLTAAAVNLQVQSGPDGWLVSTSFSDQALQENEQTPPKPAAVDVDQIHKLDSWLEDALDLRGVAYTEALPSHDDLTPAQWQRVNERAGEMFRTVLAERDAQHEMFLRDFVAASIDQQSEGFNDMLLGVVTMLEEQRNDDIVQIMSQHLDTERKLGETEARLNNLDNLVTSVVSAPTERRDPEQ